MGNRSLCAKYGVGRTYSNTFLVPYCNGVIQACLIVVTSCTVYESVHEIREQWFCSRKRSRTVNFCKRYFRNKVCASWRIMEEFLEQMRTQLSSIEIKIDNVNTRVTAIEADCQDEPETPHLSAYSTGENRVPRGTSLPNSGRAISTPQVGADDSSFLRPGNITGIHSEDIQAKFRNIRDSYRKVNLPWDVRLSAERSGIKHYDTQKLNITSNCARYSETVLMILASSNSRSLSSE